MPHLIQALLPVILVVAPPPPPTERKPAGVMTFHGAAWLEREGREAEQRPAEVFRAMGLKDGDVVADLGCGTGWFARRLAKVVAPRGKVYAVDIQPEMLDLLRGYVQKEGITNVEPVLGTETDAKVPPGSLDWILMVDVYHEFEFPFEMAEKMVEALKPGGRLVFVEFRLEDDKVPIKLVHKMSERQVIKEMGAFKEVEHTKTVATLPWQHVVIFSKKEAK